MQKDEPDGGVYRAKSTGLERLQSSLTVWASAADGAAVMSPWSQLLLLSVQLLEDELIIVSR